MSFIVNAYPTLGKTFISNRDPKTFYDMDFGRHLKNNGLNPFNCDREKRVAMAKEWGNALDIADFEGICLTNAPEMETWDVTVLPSYNRSEFERRIANRGDSVSAITWDFDQSLLEWREATAGRAPIIMIADNLSAIPLKVWVGLAEKLGKAEGAFPEYSEKERCHYRDWIDAYLTPISANLEEMIWK